MKTILTLVLVAIGFSAVAQRSSSKHITTDGRQLRIRVDIDEPNRSVHYSRTFDVANMDQSTIKSLENRIVDSLEQAPTDQVVVVSDRKDRKHSARNMKQDDPVPYTRTYENKSYEHSYEYSVDAKSTPSFSPSDVIPSSVQVREDKEAGRLWMQYTFEKDGEELIIERTANVLGKSEREKQAIIRETERSFGIKTGNQ
jgi:hypothetical protein